MGLQSISRMIFGCLQEVLRSLIQGPLSKEEDLLPVKQSFEPNGEWNPRKISFDQPNQISSTIRATPLSYNHNTEDSLT